LVTSSGERFKYNAALDPSTADTALNAVRKKVRAVGAA
jgi:hypothetical protein